MVRSLALNHRDYAELRRVHVTNPQLWAIEAGTDFWIKGAVNGLGSAGNTIITDGGWTLTSVTVAAGSAADFMTADDKGTPGHFLINDVADLIQSPALFGDYAHAHMAASIMGEKSLPRYLVADVLASFSTASSDELTSNIGFVEDGGSIVVSADIMAGIYSNSANWCIQAGGTEGVGTTAVDNSWHWFRILMDKQNALSYGYVDGTLINSVAITADEFPVGFGWGTGTNNDILVAQAHVFYAWAIPEDPSRIK